MSVPTHGSYLGELAGGTGGSPRTLLSLKSPDYTPTPEILQIVLGMLQRCYPEATAETVAGYHNKYFTICGVVNFDEYVAVDRVDSCWRIVAIPVETYRDWAERHSYAQIPPLLPKF